MLSLVEKPMMTSSVSGRYTNDYEEDISTRTGSSSSIVLSPSSSDLTTYSGHDTRSGTPTASSSARNLLLGRESDNSLKKSLNMRRVPTFQSLNRSSTPPPSPDTYYDITTLPMQPTAFLDSERPSDLRPLCQGSQCYIHTGRFAGHAVAVKSLANRSVQSSVARQEFVDEINLLSRISHDHIVSLYHYYEEEVVTPVTRPVMVLELLQGGTLRQHLDRKRPFNEKAFSKLRYLRIARELADALDYMHNRFAADCVLIHRDLKPDNIGFSSSGSLKIFDFGLCVAVPRRSESGVDIDSETSLHETYVMTGKTGSPRYMAPEVALSLPYNKSVDIYSFAIILHETITGYPWFRGVPLTEFHEMVAVQKRRPGLEYDEYGRALYLHPRLCTLLTTAWSAAIAERPCAKDVLAIVTEVEAEYQDRNEKKLFIQKLLKSVLRRKDPI